MSSTRRYNEEETAHILERAAAAEQARAEGGMALPSSADRVRGQTGMTLQQLEEIATEVGLRPEDIRSAARAVERGDLVPSEHATIIGLPIGVSRTIQLDRPMSDNEWERLVVMLRETFRAQGRVRAEGTLRSWSNGNLHVMLEPTATGQRLRLSTRKGNAATNVFLGGASMFAGLTLLFSSSGANPTMRMLAGGLFAVMGIGVVASMYVTLPKWARTRSTQMEALAAKATEILDETRGER